MKYKPNWPEAKERLTAMWEGRPLDRPCISVCAPNGKTVAWPSPPARPEDRWLDPDWVLQMAHAILESRWWGGEAMPSHLLMGGWVVSLGGTPHFDNDTIWFDPFPVDFSRPSPFRHNPDDPFVRRYEAVYCAMAQAAGKDDFLVGSAGGLPANDLISMHMGTENFLMALMDHPEWMQTAIEEGGRELLRARRHFRELTSAHEFWYGNAGWMPFWAPQPYASMQSDVSCMLSPEHFDRFVAPELDVYGRHFGAMWYHLDGGDARQHLPRLLSLPYMRVIQYTPTPSEPPNGVEHLPMYRRIQDAGRIVHIQVPKEQVIPLAKALDPARLMLDTWCDSIAEGEALLKAATQAARKR